MRRAMLRLSGVLAMALAILAGCDNTIGDVIARDIATKVDSSLSGLVIDQGTLTPAFDPATTSYTVAVAADLVSSVTVTPTASNAAAAVQVRINAGEWATVASGAASGGLSLDVGENPIEVLVIADDNETQATYTITVARTKNTAVDPVFGTSSGIYAVPFDTGLSVVLTSATSGASIHYTTDGSTPTSASGTLYTGPVKLYASATVKAVAYAENFVESAVTSATYTVNQVLYNPSGLVDANAGKSVWISSDGSTVLVGDPAASSNKGAVYVFTRSGNEWSLAQTLTGSDSTTNSYFGCSVCCSTDGSRIVVGAYGDYLISTRTGAVYVFTGGSGSWTQKTRLNYASAGAGERLGYSVACSDDCNVIVAGGPRHTGTKSYEGAVYVWYSNGETGDKLAWTVITTPIIPSTSVASDNIGTSVSCSSDGSLIVAGAPYRNTNNGAVFVFAYTIGTNTWSQSAELTASDAATGDYYGSSVACSADESTIAIGAMQDSYTSTGKAYVYSGTNWALETKLTASDLSAADTFGCSVSCSSDGSTVAVGAKLKGEDVGDTYVFTGTSWTSTRLLSSLAPDLADYSVLGCSVSCTGDGGMVVAGALGLTVTKNYQGGAYVFTLK